MGSRDKRYGVTWNTTKSRAPTTVWFADVQKRDKFALNLMDNKIVLNNSIILHNRNVDDDEL